MTSTLKTPPPLPPAGVSTQPTRLSWLIEDLLAKDGHRLTVTFTCTAAAIDQLAERQMFTEAFGASPTAGSSSVIAHFLPALRAAGADLARNESAEDLLSIPARSRWITTLKSAANETAFSCGIEVLAPFEVQVTSPSLQKERLEQMQRIAAERRSVDRAGHFARAADLLKQWESLKADVPSITPGKLLEQINPADRGLMLDTLLMASTADQPGQSTINLWAVSGTSLVRIDLRQEPAQTQLFSLPSAMGPLRSIRSANGKLLVGARNGVMIADPTNPVAATSFHHAGLNSEYGFTAVTQIGDQIWACHRDGGLVGWDINRANAPTAVFSTAGLGAEPRHLLDSGLFAVGPKIMRLSSNGPVQTPFTGNSAIVALLPIDGQLLVIEESGSITRLDPQTLETIDQLHAGGKVTSASLLPWLSTSRLLLNLTDGPIECIGLEDQLVTRFGGSQTNMRALTANRGKIAAMSNDRQRILLWNAWDGRCTSAELHMAGLTRHRLADLTFA